MYSFKYFYARDKIYLQVEQERKILMKITNDETSMLASILNEIPELLPSRLKVIIWLYENADQEGYVFQSMRGIAKKLNIAPQTVDYVFKMLISKGFLVRIGQQAYMLTHPEKEEEENEGE